jgi:hypothetical protein
MSERKTDVYGKLSSMDIIDRLYNSIGGGFLVLGAVSILIMAGIAASYLFELTPTVKYGVLFGSGMVMLFAVAYLMIYPLFVRTGFSYLSRRVERYHPELKDYLSAAVELRDKLDNNPEGYSADLIRAVISESSRSCTGIDFNRCLDKSRMAGRAKISAAIMAASLVIIAVSPSNLVYALKDFSHPSIKFEKPDPFSLEAIPGDTRMLKGDDLAIGAMVLSNPLYSNKDIVPENVDLIWTYEGSDQQYAVPMSPIDNQQPEDSNLAGASFKIELEKINRPLIYRLVSSEIASPDYRVEVIDMPRIIDLKQKLVYPRYTRLPTARIDENDGTVIALPGTEVTITIKSSKPVESARAVFEKAGTMPLDVHGDSALFSFRVRNDDVYHIEITDAGGLGNPDPIDYNVFTSVDAYPAVEIVSPGRDIVIAEADKLPVLVRARDDFGFTSLKLIYQLKTSGHEQPETAFDIPYEWDGEEELAVGVTWDISEFGMIPGDEVAYHVEVADNDHINGFKKARSKSFSVRMPSLDEILAEFDDRRDSNVTELGDIARRQKDLNEGISELKREMLRLNETDWEKSKRVEESVEMQKKISDALDKLKDSIEKNIENIEQNRINSGEIVEKSKRIAELIKEINSPELMQAIEELKEALKNVDQNQLREAMEKMEFSQEEYLERLERTLEMLKRLRAQQKFDQLKKLADKMTEEQSRIGDSIDSTGNEGLDRLADRQDEVEKELDAFNKGLDKMMEYNSETPVLPEEMLESLKNQADSSGLREDMQNSSQEMRNRNRSECSRSSSSARQKLQQISSNMQMMQDMMNSGQNEEVARIVRKAFNDLLYLSQGQESLQDGLFEMAPRDSMIRSLAPEQKKLGEKTLTVRQDLEKLYELEPRADVTLSNDLSIAAGKMNKAVERLDLKSKSASADQSEAMKYLNRVGFKLLMMMDQNSGSCSSGQGGQGNSAPQLSDLAQQQQQLNQRASGLAQQLRRSVSHQEMLSKMAAEQEAIRDGLRELLQSEEGQQPGQLGRLDDVGEEMKKVVDDFERNMVNQNTLRRQERILTRLLEAQRSLKTQGYKEERKAETGNDIIRTGPGPIKRTESEIHGRLKRLQEALKEDYPIEYRRMIKAYIDALTDELTSGGS